MAADRALVEWREELLDGGERPRRGANVLEQYDLTVGPADPTELQQRLTWVRDRAEC